MQYRKRLEYTWEPISTTQHQYNISYIYNHHLAHIQHEIFQLPRSEICNLQNFHSPLYNRSRHPSTITNILRKHVSIAPNTIATTPRKGKMGPIWILTNNPAQLRATHRCNSCSPLLAIADPNNATTQLLLCSWSQSFIIEVDLNDRNSHTQIQGFVQQAPLKFNRVVRY